MRRSWWEIGLRVNMVDGSIYSIVGTEASSWGSFERYILPFAFIHTKYLLFP